jgi:hypothetical protein
MRRMTKIVMALVLTAGMSAAASFSATNGSAEAFEKLKALAGHWECTRGEMKSTLDISLTGGGSAVVERFHTEEQGKSEEMLTTYFLDGDQLKMTHYCMAGNQPTLRGTYSPETKTITFDFVSATNLKSADDGHMHHAVYTFVDNDHLKMAWTFRKDQKDVFTEDFTYVRGK